MTRKPYRCFCYIGLQHFAEIPCENLAAYSFDVPGKGRRYICETHVPNLRRAFKLLSLDIPLKELVREGEDP